MRAVRFAAYGGPEVLEIVEVDEPQAGPGQVRIAVHAAGVNQIDAKTRAGLFREMEERALPSGSGVDASGVVDQVGDGVVGVEVGDAVLGSGTDTYAELALLDVWCAKPAALPHLEAAGYPTAVETAVRILREVGARAGQTLLVSGASGGVGSAVLQFARDRGIDVVATAGPDHQDYLRSLGARATTYGDGWVDRVRALAPDGVDAALDLAGSGVISDLVALTGDAGAVLSIADFGAEEQGARVSGEPFDPPAAFAEAVRLHTAGTFTLPVEVSLPLERAAEAQTRSARGHARGRVVLLVGA